ncbi:MAG: hypothetical protein C4308_11970 [Chitinophagaceae bacterium]
MNVLVWLILLRIVVEIVTRISLNTRTHNDTTENTERLYRNSMKDPSAYELWDGGWRIEWWI